MRYTFLFLVSFVFIACSDNSNYNNDNPYLLNVPVNVSINLTLPEYSQLKFTGNSIYIPNEGNKGIIVIKVGTGYFAWDAADPNHQQADCSVLVNSGFNATCGCSDKNTYNLATGEPVRIEEDVDISNLEYTLKFYPVRKNGSILTISN
ncbi:Rieske (2Fe-2S) protein [Algibacter pacificus]|uniref:Rieske (2Fe-2S) protein n=1 Tax=Algibacter pacificus TaxID=2599389 RepID=UPI0011C9ABDE|nr:hypothetical protein [Algibacter pacificus]